MQLIKQNKNEPNCFALSAVMVLRHLLKDKPEKLAWAHADSLYTFIGHRGQEVLWPMCSGAQKLQGIHPQEVIDWYKKFDYTLWLLERFPRSAPHGLEAQAKMIWDGQDADARFWKSIDGNPAILILATHAVAWDGEKVFDCEERNWLTEDLLNHQVFEAWLPARL